MRFVLLEWDEHGKRECRVKESRAMIVARHIAKRGPSVRINYSNGGFVQVEGLSCSLSN